MITAIDRNDADDAARAAIVTEGSRGFCAGADLPSGADTFNYRTRRGGSVAADGTID